MKLEWLSVSTPPAEEVDLADVADLEEVDDLEVATPPAEEVADLEDVDDLADEVG